MTPAEIAQLRNAGIAIMIGFTSFTAVTFFHGIFTLLFAISVVISLRRGLKTRASWAMFTITIVTYVISTLYWASDFAVIVYRIKAPLIDQSDLDLTAKIKLVNALGKRASRVSIWTSILPPVISDAVVIWRAYVLFAERRWVMALPISMLFGTTATTVTFGCLMMRKHGNGRINSRLFGASIILSMATNIITTLLITYKLWSHRRFMSQNLGQSRPRSAVQKVLYTLVESGFVYCALQVITVIVDSVPNAQVWGLWRSYMAQAFLVSYTVLSAMYPTMVIVLINTQRSFVETYGFTTISRGDAAPDEFRAATFGHLSFAAGTNTETTMSPPGSIHDIEKKGSADTIGDDQTKRHTVSAHF